MKNTLTKSNESNNCATNITINTTGAINIYGCNFSSGKDCGCGNESETDPNSGGAIDENVSNCVPLKKDGKTKQTAEAKFARLSKKAKTTSALASSFFQAAKRCFAGKEPQNEFEEMMFSRITGISKKSKNLLQCCIKQAEQQTNITAQFLDDRIWADIDQEIDPQAVAKVLINELNLYTAQEYFGTTQRNFVPVAGKKRFFVGHNETPPWEVHIFSINGKRTNDFLPPLKATDYKLEEVEHSCSVVSDSNGVLNYNCIVVPPPACKGNSVDNVCLAVPKFYPGDLVELWGSSFFTSEAKVVISKSRNFDIIAEVKATVFGDQDTPLEEVINGETIYINDSRVKDMASFTLPDDLPPGAYQFQIEFRDEDFDSGTTAWEYQRSYPQYFEMLPPKSNRFDLTLEEVICDDETGGTNWGSDEVALKVFPMIMKPNKELLIPESKLFRWDDFDSGERRSAQSKILELTEDFLGASVIFIGHEVDSESAYRNQINEITEVFVNLLRDQLQYLLTAATALGGALKFLAGVSLVKTILGVAIAAVITIAVDFFIALWAPADIIISGCVADDAYGFWMYTDFLALLSFGNVDPSIISSVGFAERMRFQLIQEQHFRSSEEGSHYRLRFRLNRTN